MCVWWLRLVCLCAKCMRLYVEIILYRYSHSLNWKVDRQKNIGFRWMNCNLMILNWWILYILSCFYIFVYVWVCARQRLKCYGSYVHFQMHFIYIYTPGEMVDGIFINQIANQMDQIENVLTILSYKFYNEIRFRYKRITNNNNKNVK